MYTHTSSLGELRPQRVKSYDLRHAQLPMFRLKALSALKKKKKKIPILKTTAQNVFSNVLYAVNMMFLC